MSDDRLRELERRWKESGTVADEAAYLTERMRIGLLTRERLWSAGLLGSQAAKLVLGQHPTWGDELRWVYAVEEQAAAVRAALLILGRLCEELALSPPPALVLTMIGVARAWLAGPREGLVGRSQAEANRCHMQAMSMQADQFDRASRSLYVSGTMIRAIEGREAALLLAEIVGRLIHDGAQVGTSDLISFLAQHRAAYRSLQDDRIRAVLLERLVPWLLGYSDPLNIQAGGA